MNRPRLWPWTHHVLDQALNIWYGCLHFKFTVPLEKLTKKFWGRYECIQHWLRKKKGCERRGAAADSLQALLKWEKNLSAKNWCFNLVPFICRKKADHHIGNCVKLGEGLKNPRAVIKCVSAMTHSSSRLQTAPTVTWGQFTNCSVQLMQIPHFLTTHFLKTIQPSRIEWLLFDTIKSNSTT